MKKQIGVVMYQTSKSKGQELVAQRMVRAFRKMGHDAYLITSLYHDGVEVIQAENLPYDGYIYSEDSELRIPVIRVNSFISKWPPRRIVFKDFIQTLENIVNNLKIDVLITHSTLWNGPEEVAKFVEWRRSIRDLGGYQDPIVFCHMSHFQEPSPKRYSLFERSFRMAWNKLSLPQIFRTASLLLVVTPYEEEAKVRMGADRDKCYLFPGGVDDELFLRFATLSQKESFERLNLKKDVKLVSYLGTVEERKNPKAIIQVAEKLSGRNDIHFVIAGHGDSRYADEIRRAAKRMPNVTYLGEIDEREKTLLVKASYLNIILSKLEALGLTQLEALGLTQLEFMFQGIPVITSGVGGQSWLIKHNQEGIHVKGPDDIGGTANAITELVDNPDTWQKLSSNAKKRASSFAFSKLIQDLDGAITASIARNSGLDQVPAEVTSTLLEPELVVKTWSSGTRKVVATDRRLFFQHGLLSRRILEIPYGKITAIEHIRRYSWRTLLAGFVSTTFLLVEPFLRPTFSGAFVARFETLLGPLISQMGLSFNIPDMIMDIVPALPMLAAALVFMMQARKGFALHGPGSPLYLPRAFEHAIAHIRKVQDEVSVPTRESEMAQIDSEAFSVLE